MEVEIQIQLNPEGALFIGGGSGKTGIGVDAATVRRQDGCLIIPGSAFKGKVRNECERIAGGFGKDICLSPVAENMCPHYSLKTRNEIYYCQICGMFGSAWLKSSLRFSDLVWEIPNDFEGDEWTRIEKTEVRPGVSLSRYTRVKKNKALFFTEVMKTGTGASFEGRIEGNLASEEDLALLICGLKTIFAIGGMKSRGLGWFRLIKRSEGYKIDNIEFSDSDFEEQLEKWCERE